MDYQYLSSKEFISSVLLTALAFLALGMQFFLLRKVRGLQAVDIVRSFGIVLIIMGTLLLIVTGYSAQNIAPAMGLFGTIAGYILGRSEKKGEEDAEKENSEAKS